MEYYEDYGVVVLFNEDLVDEERSYLVEKIKEHFEHCGNGKKVLVLFFNGGLEKEPMIVKNLQFPVGDACEI